MSLSPVQSRKNKLRQKMRQTVHSLTRRQRAEKSRSIFRKICSLPLFHNARRVMLYMPLGDEVDTLPLLKKCLQMKKRVYVPGVGVRTQAMRIYRLDSLRSGFSKGAFGIPHPDRRPSRLDPRSLDLIFIPGRAFDMKGARLGRGLGYYDRFLSGTGNAFRIGLCFKEQIVNKIDVQPHDVRMHRVITD